MKTIALATSAAHPNLTEDDQSVIAPLQALGIQARPAVWDDLSFPWNDSDAVILRSCWDYHLKLPQFLDWIAALETAGVRVWNTPSIVRWNSNKTYLRDLERKDIPIIPTFWPEASVSLPGKLNELGWNAAVIKPRVSATAHRTCMTSINDVTEGQSLLNELVAGPGAMVQKFVENIRTQGEWSLIFFSGRFSHAVIKTPKPGDFRVQHDFGGTERPTIPPRPVLEAASRAVSAVDPIPLYARVDGVEHEGQFLLMELELIEPALFLLSDPSAAGRFAGAIRQCVIPRS